MNFLKEVKIYLKSEWYNYKKYHKIKLITLLLLVILFPITFPLSVFGFLIGIVTAMIPGKVEYDRSDYKLITKMSYYQIIFNRGRIAEYFTWRILNSQPEHKKILINLYVPNKNNTMEIDSILINKYGIFVIESKGYSGWIYGNERQQEWTQCIYRHKTKFYNPIIQNRNHIIALSNILGIENKNIFKSYIVFSERCELKNIFVRKPNVRVIKRNKLQYTLERDYEKYGTVLSDSQIEEFNNKLINYMFPSEETKQKHIKYIQKIKKVN